MRSPRDCVAHAALPVACAPHGEPLADLLPGQRRLLITGRGAMVEARSPAIHACASLASFATPWAVLPAFVRLTAGPVPAALLREVIAAAKGACPAEMARLIVLRDGAYCLVAPKVIRAGVGHIQYDQSGLNEDDEVVFDIHSHGHLPAFFSSEDDASDMGRPGPHVSVVVGHCAAATPNLVARLCVPPYAIELASAQWEAWLC